MEQAVDIVFTTRVIPPSWALHSETFFDLLDVISLKLFAILLFLFLLVDGEGLMIKIRPSKPFYLFNFFFNKLLNRPSWALHKKYLGKKSVYICPKLCEFCKNFKKLKYVCYTQSFRVPYDVLLVFIEIFVFSKKNKNGRHGRYTFSVMGVTLRFFQGNHHF